jgi:hypothetical protein
MSRKLDQRSAEANGLRTLDERRQAQAVREGRDAARPVPGYGQPAGGQPDSARMPPPNGYGAGPAYGPAQVPAQAPIIVRQDSGLGHVVAGAIIARSAANAHANNHYNNGGGYYPAPSGSGGDLANQAGAGSVAGSAAATGVQAGGAGGGSVFGAIVRTVLWLLVLALIGWAAYYAWKRVKSRREANKPNYSFERN